MTNDPKAGNDLQIRDNLAQEYSDVYTPEAIAALTFMAQFNAEQKQLMNARIRRRNDRILNKKPLDFLDPSSVIPRNGYPRAGCP